MAKTRTVDMASGPAVQEVDLSRLTVARYDVNGERVGEVELPASVFAERPNPAVMHQALVRQLANARQGTASTKTRATVRGGGAKPYRQKRTGRARHGSIREPSMVGGAVVFGPHPRSYRQRMPRKMRRLALRSALSIKVAEGKVAVLDGFSFEEPRTRPMVEFLRRVGVERSALVVLPAPNQVVARSMSNLSWAKPILAHNLNLHDLFTHERLLITNDAVGLIAELFAAPHARAGLGGSGDTSGGEEAMEASDEVKP
jgi:large subunit ribosomal protein L4